MNQELNKREELRSMAFELKEETDSLDRHITIPMIIWKQLSIVAKRKKISEHQLIMKGIDCILNIESEN